MSCEDRILCKTLSGSRIMCIPQVCARWRRSGGRETRSSLPPMARGTTCCIICRRRPTTPSTLFSSPVDHTSARESATAAPHDAAAVCPLAVSHHARTAAATLPLTAPDDVDPSLILHSLPRVFATYSLLCVAAESASPCAVCWP